MGGTALNLILVASVLVALEHRACAYVFLLLGLGAMLGGLLA